MVVQAIIIITKTKTVVLRLVVIIIIITRIIKIKIVIPISKVVKGVKVITKSVKLKYFKDSLARGYLYQ